VLKWVKFASDFADNDGKQHTMVANLNQDLSQKSVLLGDGLKPSVPDIVVFAAVQAVMVRMIYLYPFLQPPSDAKIALYSVLPQSISYCY
jgi:hypothetical protein